MGMVKRGSHPEQPSGSVGVEPVGVGVEPVWVAVGVAEVEGMQAMRRPGLRRHLRHQHLRLDRQGVVLPLGKRGPEYHHLVATSALFASTPSRQNHVRHAAAAAAVCVCVCVCMKGS